MSQSRRMGASAGGEGAVCSDRRRWDYEWGRREGWRCGFKPGSAAPGSGEARTLCVILSAGGWEKPGATSAN